MLRRIGMAALAVGLAVSFLAGCGGSTTPVVLPTAGGTLRPMGPVLVEVPVERVVDGDTVKVLANGRSLTVRMIGIDTPETVKEGTAVQCFGPEASDFAKVTLEGTRITLELDPSQGERDRYGRTLAYVWRQLSDGTLSLFNAEAVEHGFARERQYGNVPYAWRSELRERARLAQANSAGLWAAC